EAQPFPEMEIELPGGAREKMVSPERECILDELYEVSLAIPIVGNREELAKSLSLLQKPQVTAFYTDQWMDEMRDLRNGAIPFIAFSEEKWKENRALLGDIIRGKDPTLEARRTFSLALIYGKLTSGMHPDIASHRSVLYGFKRPIDLMETK